MKISSRDLEMKDFGVFLKEWYAHMDGYYYHSSMHENTSNSSYL